jgi:hypothetical protein
MYQSSHPSMNTRMSIFMRTAAISLLLVPISLNAKSQGVSGSNAQNTTPPQSVATRLDEIWRNAPNQWQRTPIDSTKQVDTVSPDVRALRNSYWMQPPQNRAIRMSSQVTLGAVFDSRRPEVGPARGGSPSVWVVATFEGFHVYTIEPGQPFLYTEANMRVSTVIKEPKGANFSSGLLLDVNYLGGSLKTATGDIMSSRLTPQQYAPRLGHTYILQLVYIDQYDTLMPYKRWDVTSGTVQPDDALEVYRASHGKSVLKGKFVSEAINYIRSVLPDEAKER